jgi:hypothetical protein
LFGKWHLGFFKAEYTPWKRGFGSTAGIINAEADHYTHLIGDGYDWHVNGTTDYGAALMPAPWILLY